MKKLLVLSFILLLGISAHAQLADKATLENSSRTTSIGVEPAVTPFSLLDFSKIRWSNSYSVSFFSGGNYSGSVGLLNSTMFYDFSSKLSLALNVGIMHNPGSLWNSNQSTDATILPGFLLDYHPSDKFSISVGMQSYRGYLGYPMYYQNSLREAFFR